MKFKYILNFKNVYVYIIINIKLKCLNEDSGEFHVSFRYLVFQLTRESLEVIEIGRVYNRHINYTTITYNKLKSLYKKVTIITNASVKLPHISTKLKQACR